ncbi:MAG: RlmE family RNA methyltransferase [Deltaproteobacteria bacterium]|nr:RlmE family RNA methyltransferase [Deltaproteobacteria bacterium]
MGNYDRKDHLYKKAKEEGLRARSSYKLEELDKMFKLFRPGLIVLDLGCAPGGWIQVALRRLKGSGKVIGIDRLDVIAFSKSELQLCNSLENPPVILKGDITSDEVQQQVINIAGRHVDLVLSDMSPDLSGVHFQDAARSAELVEIAFDLARKMLIPGGNVIAKIFPGPEADQLFKEKKASYKSLSRVELKSSRKTSKEFYLVGQGFIPRLEGN